VGGGGSLSDLLEGGLKQRIRERTIPHREDLGTVQPRATPVGLDRAAECEFDEHSAAEGVVEGAGSGRDPVSSSSSSSSRSSTISIPFCMFSLSLSSRMRCR
jgi:hypothetical protein